MGTAGRTPRRIDCALPQRLLVRRNRSLRNLREPPSSLTSHSCIPQVHRCQTSPSRCCHRSRSEITSRTLEHFHFYSEQDRAAKCGFFLRKSRVGRGCFVSIRSENAVAVETYVVEEANPEL